MLPSLDVMKEYLGLIHTYPDMVQVHRGAMGKVHDCEKMKEEGRIDVRSCFLRGSKDRFSDKNEQTGISQDLYCVYSKSGYQ